MLISSFHFTDWIGIAERCFYYQCYEDSCLKHKFSFLHSTKYKFESSAALSAIFGFILLFSEISAT